MSTLDRREFLKLSTVSAAAAAFRPPDPEISPSSQAALGRVTTTWIGVYSEPSFQAPQLGRLTRDEVITLRARERSDEGPSHNPLWYRISDGYAHSGHLQIVRWMPQEPIEDLPEKGAIFEVSVPFTRTYRQPDSASSPLYRLYYQSTAWVEKLVQGADGRGWYQLIDDLLRVRYYARAEHLRRVTRDELAPISPDVPGHHKRIEVSRAHQELRAFERDKLIFKTRISSGIPDKRPRDNGVPPITPSGNFYVDRKMPLRHMGNGDLTSDLEAYELPGVPWVSFFTSTGVAFHGTYWHADFGRPRSNGCINMQTDEARWLFRWTSPVVPDGEILEIGRGTAVTVF